MHLPDRILKNIVVVDTGPLYEFLLLNFIESTGYWQFSEYLNFAQRKSSQTQLRSLFDKFELLTTTPGVIAEIFALVRRREGGPRLEDSDHKLFWEKSIPYFSSKKIGEELIQLITMANSLNTLGKCGPIDTSVVELAKSHKAPLFSVDGKVYKHCQTNRIPIEFILLDKKCCIEIKKTDLD